MNWRKKKFCKNCNKFMTFGRGKSTITRKSRKRKKETLQQSFALIFSLSLTHKHAHTHSHTHVCVLCAATLGQVVTYICSTMWRWPPSPYGFPMTHFLDTMGAENEMVNFALSYLSLLSYPLSLSLSLFLFFFLSLPLSLFLSLSLPFSFSPGNI